MSQFQIGFLGGGQMATAIARGAIEAGRVTSSQIAFVDTNAGQCERLAKSFPDAALLSSPAELWEKSNRIILAVKPQTLEQIAGSLLRWNKPEHLLVSIAAGIPLSKLTTWFGSERIIRVMPNTPCQSRQGASGIAVGIGATAEDRAWCDAIFSSIGTIVHVTDDQIHGVTGVSGSGPAYVLMFIEALSDGGVRAGLSRETAQALAVQTVLGTATMVKETGVHPAILREQVTSPGGTTIAALHALESSAFRAAVMDAVSAAVNRSRELGSPIRKTES